MIRLVRAGKKADANRLYERLRREEMTDDQVRKTVELLLQPEE